MNENPGKRGLARTAIEEKSLPGHTLGEESGRTRRFRARTETAEPDPRRHWGDRRGYILRRLLVGADVLALVCAGAITQQVIVLAGRALTSTDVVLFLLLLLPWTYIATPTPALPLGRTVLRCVLGR